MDYFSKNKDLTQIFDEQYRANYKKNEAIQREKNHFNNKMYGIKDDDERRRELRKMNSVEGQVERLNQKMQALNTNKYFKN